MNQILESCVDKSSSNTHYTHTINMIRTRKISNINSTAMDKAANWPKNNIKNLTSPNNFGNNDLENNLDILKIIENQQKKSLVRSTPIYLKPLKDIGVGNEDENKMPDDTDSKLDIIKYGEKVFNNMGI